MSGIVNIKRFGMPSAFTLAEVLITLGIIGIVAAMTIPTLVSNYQKKQYVTQLKKFYSIFNQALLEIAVEGGCPDNLNCAFLDSSVSQFDTVAAKFKVAKNCKSSGNLGEGVCFTNKMTYVYDDPGYGKSYFDDSGDYYRFITVDGTAIALPSGSGAISGDVIVVDVNGPAKNPNKAGRDIFFFYINSNGKPLLNFPSTTNPSYCNPTQRDSFDCANRIVQDGWEMTY